MNIDIKPIGFVKAGRTVVEDDFWGGADACISLAESFTAEALQGLASFSHAEVLFLLHLVPASKIVLGARHPRHQTGARGVSAAPGNSPAGVVARADARLLSEQGSLAPGI